MKNTLYLLFSPCLSGVTQAPMEYYMVFVVTNGQKRSNTIGRTISALYLSQSIFSSAAEITNLWWKDTCTHSIGFTHVWHNQITRFALELREWLWKQTGNMDLALVQLENAMLQGHFVLMSSLLDISMRVWMQPQSLFSYWGCSLWTCWRAREQPPFPASLPLCCCSNTPALLGPVPACSQLSPPCLLPLAPKLNWQITKTKHTWPDSQNGNN